MGGQVKAVGDSMSHWETEVYPAGDICFDIAID